MNATAYTPLESLLLFQSLAAFGTEPNVFAQISNLLKNNVLIQECDKYDAGRLSPDALRELYLQLLREELRNELEAELPGDASPSRKRKIQGPSLPTIGDAKNYKGKIPQLVDRLYSRYRDHMIRAIREDERKYEQLSREIAEIGRGEWDERLRQEQNRGSRTSSEDFRRPPSIPRSSAQPERPVSRDTDRAKIATPSPAPSPRTETRPEGLSINDVLNSTEPAPLPTHAPEKDSISRLKNGNHSLPPMSHHRTASSERPHGPSPLQQNQRLPPPSDWKWENSYQATPAPPPLPPHQAQPQPPHGYPPPYPSQQQQQQQQQQQPPQYGQYPPRGSFSGSTPQPHSVPSSPHAPHNPIVLPPLNGRGSGSPASHLDQLAEAADQQYRPAQSPLVQQQTSGPPMPPQYTTSAPQTPQYMPVAPQPHPYPAQYGQHPPAPPAFIAPSRPTQTPPPPQWNSQQNGYQQYPPQQQPPPANNNYYPAPAAAPPPAPAQAPLPQARQTQPPPFAPRPEQLPQIQNQQYNSPYNAGFARPPGPDVKGTPIQKPLFKDHLKESAPSTPASRPQSFQTGKSTLWKIQATPGTPKPPVTLGKAGFLPESPAYEPISPPPPQPALSLPTSELAKQQTPQTGQKDQPRRGRPFRARESSDAPTEPGTPSRNGPASAIKKENLAQQRIRDLAPANPESSLAPPTGPPTPSANQSTSAAESSDEFAVPQAVASSSRKRKLSPEPATERECKPATHVLWTRNFPKISASALERIGAHRTASTFALPIKDRDAPGYREAIKRPMDLKSIKAAITAGNRAGTAILKEMEERGEEVDKNAMVVELPVTRELVPPKGIVNSRQLERELMLMFANAVMFNPDSERGINLRRSTRNRREGGYALDEDGVVKDARTMAADVQVIINELRETERKRESESESMRSSVAREQEKGSASREELERGTEESAAEGPAKKRKRTTKE